MPASKLVQWHIFFFWGGRVIIILFLLIPETRNRRLFFWEGGGAPKYWIAIFLVLTPSLRRPCIHAIFFPTACRTVCKHVFCFLRVRPEAVSTRHSWLWQTLDDVYTRRCFSESEGTRFGAPGQKALPSGNEWTEWNEWMDFCLIPLSTTGSVEVPGTNL